MGLEIDVTSAAGLNDELLDRLCAISEIAACTADFLSRENTANSAARSKTIVVLQGALGRSRPPGSASPARIPPPPTAVNAASAQGSAPQWTLPQSARSWHLCRQQRV
jgi:hypothetical protein